MMKRYLKIFGSKKVLLPISSILIYLILSNDLEVIYLASLRLKYQYQGRLSQLNQRQLADTSIYNYKKFTSPYSFYTYFYETGKDVFTKLPECYGFDTDIYFEDAPSKKSIAPELNSTTIFIKSQIVAGYKNRKIIRSTYGRYAQIIFIVSLPQELYDPDNLIISDLMQPDMLVINVSDNYINLSFKVAAGLIYANQCHTNAFFTDDDVFLFLKSIQNSGLLILPKSANHQNPEIHCHKLEASIPNRYNLQKIFDSRSYRKYFISFQDFPYPYFPPFCNGIGYIINFPAVQKLYKNLDSIQMVHNLDDVYLGMLAQGSSVSIKHSDRFDAGWSKFLNCDVFNIHRPEKLVRDGFYEYKEQVCLHDFQFQRYL